jgi:GNAT superfamily N-acetyltransferase
MARQSEYTIRAFIPEDAPAMCHLCTRAILATPETFHSEAERISWAHGLTPQGYIDASNKDETFEVAVRRGQVIGFCGRTAKTVRGLYVDPDCQGQGIGLALLSRAETVLQAQGRTSIDINASCPAETFYTRAGYIKIAERKRASRGGLMMNACIMRKEIFKS